MFYICNEVLNCNDNNQTTVTCINMGDSHSTLCWVNEARHRRVYIEEGYKFQKHAKNTYDGGKI